MPTLTRPLGRLALVGAVVSSTLLTAGAADAHRASFSDFTPLEASAGPTADEATPVTLSSPAFAQESIIDRETQLAGGSPNSGNFDMNTVNETGRNKGRYLFTVFETGQAGIQRHDLKTGQTDTVYISPEVAPTPGAEIAFDASYWTPWGTFVTAEERWCTQAGGCTTSGEGRLFELRNPLTAPAITGPVTAASNAGADLVHHNIIPRTSHEGIQFDDAWNMYFIDELNGGAVYRYTPAAKKRDILKGRADYFAAGQVFVLRVGDGNTPNATGKYEWIPITDETGHPLEGTLVITDPNGTTSLDGRNTTDLADFKGTDYQRPEDLQIQKVRGREYLYMATTTTNEVYRLDLRKDAISVFANRDTLDLATGTAVGDQLTSPDNLAIDHEGNIYVIEDQPGGVSDDIWFARDRNRDGDLLDHGEGLARWASNGTPGSEFTGLYFDPFNRNRAWVNIQHPTSGNDRTIELTVGKRDDHKGHR